MDWFLTYKFKMSRNMNEAFALAVMKGNFGKVLDLLSSGADVNMVMKYDNTLLHLVTAPEITESLLLHGANVNALNIDGETALHSAITKKKGLSIVNVLLKHGADINIKNNFGQTPLHCAVIEREGLSMVSKLLKHGANVNATDNKHNSVLFLVVKYYKNFEIIKELLEYGADIFIRSSSLNRFFTPIDVAIHKGDVCCAQLLIKITVLKNYQKCFRKICVLQNYIKLKDNPTLSCYLDECALEISGMKMDKMNNIFSLFDYVKMDGNVKPFYLSNGTFDVGIVEKYRIYQDIILASLKPCIQRGKLLDKLKSSQISSTIRKNVLLNGDCLFKIGELLSNDDILHFVIAIDKYVDSSDYSLDKCL